MHPGKQDLSDGLPGTPPAAPRNRCRQIVADVFSPQQFRAKYGRLPAGAGVRRYEGAKMSRLSLFLYATDEHTPDRTPAGLKHYERERGWNLPELAMRVVMAHGAARSTTCTRTTWATT